MNLLDSILGDDGNSGTVQQLSQQFGIDPSQAASALQALVPALAAGVQNNVQQDGGLDSLMAALSGGQHQRYLNDPAMLADMTTAQDGNGILGHLFGSKDVSRQVAGQTAAQTGISPDLIKKMLPIVATLVMGALAKRASAGSANADLPDGLSQSPLGSGAGGGLMDMIGATLGQGGSGEGGGGGGLGDLLGKLFR